MINNRINYINREERHIHGLIIADSAYIEIDEVPEIILGQGSPRINRSDSVTKPIEKSIFKELADYVEKLLDIHLHKQLRRMERAEKLGNTKYVPHRLAYLYQRMIKSLETMNESPPSCDIPALIELQLFCYLVEEFKTGPVWKDVESELNSKGSFVHLLCLLAFLHNQRMRGTDAFLVSSNSELNQKADAVMFTPLIDQIDVEVKCPEVLWAPSSITEDYAEKIIEKCWKKAKGQIDKRVSILVIGGIFVPKDSLDALEQAAQKFFDCKDIKNMAFIVILSVTVLVREPIFEGDRLGIGRESTASPQIVMRQAINKSYDGIVSFFESQKSSLPEEEIIEIKI